MRGQKRKFEMKRAGEWLRRALFPEEEEEEEREEEEEIERAENRKKREKKNTSRKKTHLLHRKTSIRATISKIIVMIFILFTLCAILAQTLVHLESREEEKRREIAFAEYSRAKEAMEKLAAFSAKDEYYFPIEEIYMHYREDLEEKKNLMELRQWNFKGAFFFVVTVFTTIGYGNMTPRTNEGKLVVLLTTIPVLAISLITIVTIAEPIIDSLNLLHKRLLFRMKHKMPIDITIPSKCTLEEYFDVLVHHLIGEAFWPMTEVYVRINQIYTQDEGHKGEVFLSKEEFVETCQRLWLRINNNCEDTSTEAEETEEQESVLNLEEIRLLLEVIRSKASLTSTGVQLVHCLLFSVLAVVSGMFYFKAFQDWNYLEAAYFSVVSITSVGLGDYVPDHQKGSVAFWYPYVFIGFGFITVFIGTLATFAEKGREKRSYEFEFKYVHECYNAKRRESNTNTYWDETELDI